MIEFFRDTLSGVNYYIYVAINVLFIFALIGYIGEKKENESKNNENKLAIMEEEFNEFRKCFIYIK